MSSIRHALGYTKPLQATHGRVEEKPYRDFIKTLPCVVRGTYGVDPAHISTHAPQWGHVGRGKGTKASDRWCLPLCREEHDHQSTLGNSGRAEMAYWRICGINPHALACALYGAWCELKDQPETAHEICERIIAKARLLPME